jgi:hypothetical protein
MAVSHVRGAGRVFRAWMILAVLLAVAVVSAAAALRRRYLGVRRRRHYISPQTQSVVRWAGFRYSSTRKAYVLRLVGNFIGPVLKTEMSLPPNEAEGPVVPVAAMPAARRTPPARSRHTTTTPGATAKRTRTGASRTS